MFVGPADEEPRRPPEVFPENGEIWYQCQGLQEELRQYDRKLGKTQAEHDSYMNHMLQFTEKLNEAEAQLNTVKQDLNANISFAPHEGTLDRDELVKRFKDLLHEHEATVNSIMQHIPPDLLNESFTGYRGPESSRAFDKQETNFIRLASDVSRRKSLTYRDIVFPILAHSLCTDLHPHILNGFTSTVDKNQSKLLEQLMQEVRQFESQENGARWRAMTYAHMTRDTETLVHLADESLGMISSKLCDLFATSHEVVPNKECHAIIQALFMSATEFWDSAQTMCTKYHVQVIGSSSLRDVPNTWIAVTGGERGKTPTEVIMVTTLGLAGVRLVEGTDGKLERKRYLLSNLLVIGNTWINAPNPRQG